MAMLPAPTKLVHTRHKADARPPISEILYIRSHGVPFLTDLLQDHVSVETDTVKTGRTMISVRYAENSRKGCAH